MAMTLELSHQPMHPFFIPWCAGGGRHKRLVGNQISSATEMVIPAIESMPRTPIRGWNPAGGVGTPDFHTVVWRQQPA